MEPELYRNAMGLAFGILQAFMLTAIAAAFKTYFDVRQHNRDIAAAFHKIRDLERTIREDYRADMDHSVCDQDAERSDYER